LEHTEPKKTQLGEDFSLPSFQRKDSNTKKPRTADDKVVITGDDILIEYVHRVSDLLSELQEHTS
jgi:hypothetical protein